jgi:hypothetical protein
VWVSLLLFTKLFLDKLAELIFQKLVHLEEQLFTVNCDLTVIWYNPTYADTYAFEKPTKKSLNTHFLRQFFTVFSLFCFVRLQKSLIHDALLSITRNFPFGGKKPKKQKVEAQAKSIFSTSLEHTVLSHTASKSTGLF